MVRKSDEAGSLLQRINELIEAVHKIGVWFAYRQALRRLGASAKRKATCDSVAAVSHPFASLAVLHASCSRAPTPDAKEID
jgi:hypothetical protein